MSNTDVVRLYDPCNSFRGFFDVGYSHGTGRCVVKVRSVWFCTVRVACNEVAVVAVLTEKVV